MSFVSIRVDVDVDEVLEDISTQALRSELASRGADGGPFDEDRLADDKDAQSDRLRRAIAEIERFRDLDNALLILRREVERLDREAASLRVPEWRRGPTVAGKAGAAHG